jgi:geranylgeranyl reductase family protein
MAGAADVLIVGGGPAGATAARTLALEGRRVRLLDRTRFPRNKPCGGAISMRALRRFPYLPDALGRIPTRRLCRLYLEAPSGHGITLTSHEPAALMVRRIEFDALLLDLAREAGVDVVEGVEVSRTRELPDRVWVGARDGREFEAPLLIAADGVNSVIGRRLGINPGWPAARVAIDMMEETPDETLRSIDADTLWVAYGYGGSEGYAYVFPKAHHVNVGIGYVLEWFRAHVDEAPYDLQRRFIADLQHRRVLEGFSSRSHFTPYLIPIGGPLPRTATSRVLLAGDAAGFVNGITAEGIYYAMVSGHLAARSAATGSTQGYERSWRAEIGAELRDAVLVQRHLLTTPERINALVNAARRAPGVADLLVRYAMGEVSYLAARRRVLLRAPLLAIRLFVAAQTSAWSALRRPSALDTSHG